MSQPFPNAKPEGLVTRLTRSVMRHPVRSLTVLSLATVVIAAWHFSGVQTQLIRTSALQSARGSADAIAHFRKLYSETVVGRARGHGLVVTHDYKGREDAIPLPATLVVELADAMGKDGSGASAQLYSPFPFPWRAKEGGLRDDFSRDAWQFLIEHPTETFHRFEEVNGQPSLRYATADRMVASCVDCHNNHAQTPKSDWAIGDVRGVLEIVQPLHALAAQAGEQLAGTTVFLVGCVVLAIVVLGLVAATTRRTANEVLEINALLRREIEVRKAAESGVRENAERFQQLAENINQVFWLTDWKTKELLYVSPDYENLYGRPRDELYADRRSWLDVIHPDDRGRVDEAFAKGGGDGAYTEAEYRIVRDDGTVRWVCDRAFPIRDVHGDIYRFVGLAEDITQRKEADVALRESQDRFEFAIGGTSDGLWDWNLITNDVWMAPRFKELLGYADDEMVSSYESWESRLHPDDKMPTLEAVRLHLEERQRFDVEFRLRTKSRCYRWFRIRASAERDQSGKPLRMGGSIQDITDRKKVQDALRLSKEQLEKRVSERTAELTAANAHLRYEIEERVRAEHGLVSQKRAIDEHSIVAITDLQGRITYANRKFCEISGYSMEELIGQDHRIVNSGLHPKPFFQEMWTTIRSGCVWRGVVRNRAKDGSHYWVDSTIVPLKDASGVIEEYVAIRTDVTERVAAEEGLRQAKVAAESANRAKSEFLANMSHEIRTPMTAILGFAENLFDETISESQRLNAVNTIHRNGKHLLQIINDVLDVSKIEAGEMRVESVSCSLCEVVSEVVSLMKPRGVAKGLEISVEYAGEVPATIQTDPTRLTQILLNLFSNSIKFTDSGSVKLTVAYEQEKGTQPTLHFDVLDSGIGMTSEQASLVFKAFTQADGTTTRNFGGTGLGLTISKWYARKLGGDLVVVESVPDAGTRMRLTIDPGSMAGVRMLDRPAETSLADAQAHRAAPRTQKRLDCRILLAEDGVDNQRLLSFILNRAGADVAVVENGKKAVETAMAATQGHRRDDAHRPFDVILMDMQMPVMDGYCATRQLRSRGYTGLVIALTANAMEQDRQKCLDAGCDDFATKPIDREKLISMIQKRVAKSDSALPAIV